MKCVNIDTIPFMPSIGEKIITLEWLPLKYQKYQSMSLLTANYLYTLKEEFSTQQKQSAIANTHMNMRLDKDMRGRIENFSQNKKLFSASLFLIIIPVRTPFVNYNTIACDQRRKDTKKLCLYQKEGNL